LVAVSTTTFSLSITIFKAWGVIFGVDVVVNVLMLMLMSSDYISWYRVLCKCAVVCSQRIVSQTSTAKRMEMVVRSGQGAASVSVDKPSEETGVEPVDVAAENPPEPEISPSPPALGLRMVSMSSEEPHMVVSSPKSGMTAIII